MTAVEIERARFRMIRASEKRPEEEQPTFTLAGVVFEVAYQLAISELGSGRGDWIYDASEEK